MKMNMASLNEKQKVEVWLQENGWHSRHINFRGTCWMKGNFQIIFDYGGIAVREADDITHETRIRSNEQLQDVLAPYLPTWVIDELSVIISNPPSCRHLVFSSGWRVGNDSTNTC